MLFRARTCLVPLIATLFGMASPAWAQDQDGDGTLDSADNFPCNAQYSGLAYAPAKGVHGTLLFEDLWPGPNDSDSNDVVLGYNYVYYLDAQNKVVRVVGTFTPRALGGKLHTGLGLHLEVPASAVASVTRSVSGGAAVPLSVSPLDSEFTVDVSSDLREFFSGTEDAINARTDLPRQAGQTITLDITLSTPQALFSAQAPHDLFLFHTLARGHELHRHMYPGTALMDQTLFGTQHDTSRSGRWFVDHTEIPSALDLPSSAAYPAEGVEIAQLYPNIIQWALSGGTVNQDFYVSDIQGQFAYADSNGQGAIGLATPHTPTVDVSCVAVDVITQSNATYNASNIASIMGSNWTVPSGVTVTIDYAGPIQVYSLDLAGALRPAGCTTTRCATLDIQVLTDATIAPTGHLHADGLGYLGSYQSGNGARGRTQGNVVSSASYQTGGSHGGLGGRYGASPTPAYDQADHPSEPGAGGTGYNNGSGNYNGGNGGGVVKMTVGGRLTIDGLISADGGRGGVYDCGGAGGSVWLQAAELSGNSSGARVRANGAYGYYSAGGGGRVAIYGTPTGGFSVNENTVMVRGGAAATGGPYYGGSGTVVHGLDQAGQAHLLLHSTDANYNSRAGNTRVGAFGAVTGVSNSVLTTSARLEPGALLGKTLKPDADGSQTFVIASNTGSTITVVGGGLSAATAVNRAFYVTDYEARYASVTLKGAVGVDAGYFDVVGTAGLSNSSNLNILDLKADVLDLSGSTAVNGDDFGVRQLHTAGTSVLTAKNVDFTQASLAGNSQLTTWAPTTAGVQPLTLTGQDLDLSVGARVQVDGLGYLGSYSTGNGARARTDGNATTNASYQTGGSHGGHGGRYGATVAASYGDLYRPTTAGSGGTGYNNSGGTYNGGNGGGVLRINLSGTLSNDGLISADGGRGAVYDTGGAGGSVWVSAQTLQRSVSGVGFSAKGAYGYYAGGGGGRIALENGAVTGWAIDPATVHAYGGAAATGSAYYGGPGTILYRSATQASGHLLVHSPTNYRSGFSDTIIVPSTFDHVTLIGDSHVDTTQLQLTGTLSLQNSSTLDMTSLQANTLDMSGATRLYGADVLASQATLQSSAIATLQNLDAGQLDMTGTTILTGWAPHTGGVYPLYVIAGTLSLGASARIHVDGLGYLGSYSAGNGARARTDGNVTTNASYQTGGSHGGYGGQYGSTVAQQFGDLHQPVTAGSGGTGYNNSSGTYNGGNGGGVLRLDVAGTLTLDGVVSANGGRGAVNDTGGAGGSVWINAGTLATTRSGSRVQANGAYGYYAGGGGGRVALYYNALSGWSVNAATVQANGGAAATGANSYGGPGPILYQPTVNARPSVLITAPTSYFSRYGRTQLGEFGTVSSVSGSVLSSNRPLRPGVLAGLTLVPNAENESNTFTIVSNTAATITVQGSLSSATAPGATWYVSDYATRFEDLTIQGDAEVEAGYLDVANQLVVEATSDLLASDVDALTYVQRDSAHVYLKRLGFQDATLSGSARLTQRLSNGTNQSLQGSAIVTGWAPSTVSVYPLVVMSTNLDVGPSAMITVAGLGYLGSYQAGNGSRARTDGNVVSNASYQTGGSHAGLGGGYGANPTATFGDPDQPLTAGSGGTSYNNSGGTYNGGNGGGILRVDVPGVLQHDGLLDANGGRGSAYDTGGAGGAVWVTAGTVNGGGVMRVDGAYGYYAGGGGGRVAVYTTGGSWTPSTSRLRSNGGAAATGGSYAGQTGTTRYILQ